MEGCDMVILLKTNFVTIQFKKRKLHSKDHIVTKSAATSAVQWLNMKMVTTPIYTPTLAEMLHIEESFSICNHPGKHHGSARPMLPYQNCLSRKLPLIWGLQRWVASLRSMVLRLSRQSPASRPGESCYEKEPWKSVRFFQCLPINP